MKYALSLAAVLALATAQSITDLPSCSLSCIVNGVSSIGCSATDFACSCKKADQLTPAITPCVQKACSSLADQTKVVTVLDGICKSAGVPISIAQPGASSAASSSAAPQSTSEAPESSSDVLTVETTTPIPTPSATDVVITSVSASPIPSSNATTPHTTGSASSGSLKASGTGQPSGTAAATSGSSGSGVPQFTAAAIAVKIPAGLAGVLGLIAYLY